MEERISAPSIQYFTADFLDCALNGKERYDLNYWQSAIYFAENMDDGTMAIFLFQTPAPLY